MKPTVLLALLALAPFASADSPVVTPAASSPATPSLLPDAPMPGSPTPDIAPADLDLGAVQFSIENDKYSCKENFDRYYTNGGTLVYIMPSDTNGRGVWASRSHFGIGQEMYTAQANMVANPPANDHPYSAWSYALIGHSWDDGVSLDILTLRAGVVGPSALGRQTQNFVHSAIGEDKRRGWDTQLHDEPGINLEWRRSWRIPLGGRTTGYGADLLPMVFAECGTMRDSAAAGLQLRFGKNLPADYGVMDQRKGGLHGTPTDASAGKGYSVSPDSVYGFVDLRGELWVFNMALDGNLYHDSRAVETTDTVRQAGFGIAAHWGRTRLSFSQYIRSKEFGAQRGNFYFGGVTLSQSF